MIKLLTFLMLIFYSSSGYCADSADFMEEYFQEIDAQDAADKTAHQAQTDAADLMSAEPTMLSLPEEQLKLLQESEKELQKRRNTLQNQQKPAVLSSPFAKTQQSDTEEKQIDNYEKAPFGLYWEASAAQTAELGFELKPITLEDLQNTYTVVNHKQTETFASIIVEFGKNDALSAIYAEGNLLNDTPAADKALDLYDRYFAALKTKYGNSKQVYKTTNNEKNINPHENQQLLNDIYAQKASLYATFGDKVKITLAIEALSNTQSRITLDFINLSIRQKELKATFDNLLDEL